MRLEARLSYALIGLVQATGYAGGLDLAILSVIFEALYAGRILALYGIGR